MRDPNPATNSEDSVVFLVCEIRDETPRTLATFRDAKHAEAFAVILRLMNPHVGIVRVINDESVWSELDKMAPKAPKKAEHSRIIHP